MHCSIKKYVLCILIIAFNVSLLASFYVFFKNLHQNQTIIAKSTIQNVMASYRNAFEFLPKIDFTLPKENFSPQNFLTLALKNSLFGNALISSKFLNDTAIPGSENFVTEPSDDEFFAADQKIRAFFTEKTLRFSASFFEFFTRMILLYAFLISILIGLTVLNEDKKINFREGIALGFLGGILAWPIVDFIFWWLKSTIFSFFGFYFPGFIFAGLNTAEITFLPFLGAVFGFFWYVVATYRRKC